MRLALFACLLSTVSFAQEFRGTFSGMVTDAQGGAIAKARIVATEVRTGAKSETYSEASGAFAIPFLAVGEYEVSAELAGFKKFVRQGVALGMGQHPVIDIRLDVGTVSESVTVMEDAPLIESANASVGQVITAAEVEDFPLAGRTPLMLAQLALGVVSTGQEPGQSVRPFDNNTPASFSLGGAPGGINELLYNGSPNAGFTNQIAYSPPQDSVLQVRVNAFESDASFGHTGGGTANQITKGGTNSLHGAASEFFQNANLNANTFFFNKAGVPRPMSHHNQYGVSAGAPVRIPGLFNGRNRVFWFFAWEGIQAALPDNSPLQTSNPVNFTTVPTAAQRQGDFSGLLKANAPGTDYSIYDPASATQSGSQITRRPFPGNIIPASRLNPVALKYLEFYPLPNTPGRIDGFQNYLVSISDKDGYDNELGRLDFNISDKHKLSFDARHSHRAQINKYNYFGNGSTGQDLFRTNQGASLDNVYTITPSVVLDVRANWTRFIQTYGTGADGRDPGAVGFPAYLANNATELRMPEIIFTSTSVTAGSAASYESLFTRTGGADTWDSFQLFGILIKIRGNHTFKTGADARNYRWSRATPGFSTGAFTFSTNWTRGPQTNSAASPLGQDLASFLLGLPASGNYPINSSSTTGIKYAALFLQDDWRARNDLTLNLGLRWEHETPATERFNRAINGFDPTASNPVSAPAAAAYAANPIAAPAPAKFQALGGLTFPTASDPYIYHTKSSVFSPRVGFAWTPRQLGRQTVLRGGLGMFVMPVGISGNGQTNGTVTLNQQGFSQTTQFVATNDNYLTSAGTLSNPFPNGIVKPAGSTGGTGTYLGQAITFYNTGVRNGYSLRWCFGVQRQLPAKMVLEVVYIGNHAVRLPITTQLDYIPRQYLSTSPVRDQTTINLLGASVANPFRGLLPNSSSQNGATVSRQQLLIPFPQYPVPGTPASTSNGVVMQGNPAGGSYFHSLNVRLQKRFTNGLTFINNFSWNKLVDHLAYLNDSDTAPEKRISSDSRPLRNVLAGTYELPIGRRKRFDPHSRLGNALVGGWKLNGMLTFQIGPPLTGWGNVIYYGGPINFNTHQPDGVALDITRFERASNQQLSSNVRTFNTQYGNLRRDMTKNVDLSMSKSFSLGEPRYLQVRFETFNSTNRVTFGAPNISPTASNFAVIATQANAPRTLQLGMRLVW
jgi:hypothetical protein